MVEITLPQLTLSMETGVVARWLVGDRSTIAVGEPVAEIETDKAVSELESPFAGTIHLLVDEGSEHPVGARLAEVDEGAGDRLPAAAAVPGDEPAAAAASPATRRAAESDVDLATAERTGPGDPLIAANVGGEAGDSGPMSLRRAVVANIVASWREIPHIHLTAELDATALVAARRSAAVDATYTDFLLSATATALLEVPDLNGGDGQRAHPINVALAVATSAGVVAPVVRDVGELTIAQIAARRRLLVEAAREGRSDPRDLAGGTFTLTNLGGHAVDFFSPVITGPQIAILAVGRIAERPAFVDGQLVGRPSLWATVAIDHRHADGEAGGRFLTSLQHAIDELGR